MDRLAIFFLGLTALATLPGCGSKAESPLAAQAAPATAQTPAPTAPTAASPTDVVSQFLDEVRRGGEDSRANELLTEKARMELQRIGQSIQPIGSPDARFQVTRAESVPGDEDSALVHSVWSEPNQDGSKSDFQVVWAVQNEPAGWRISGLAMELEPGQQPLIMDFENAELMSSLLSGSEAKPADPTPPTQAATTSAAISR